MEKHLWASRHPWPDPHWEPGSLDQKEILWPVSFADCQAIWEDLLKNYSVFYGVFPAQAIEALNAFRGLIWVYSPVSMPIYEADSTKVRKFKFVRWAQIM